MALNNCILYVSCAKYSDALAASLCNIRRFWSDLDLDVFVLAEAEIETSQGYNSIVINSDDWIDRLRNAINQLSDYKYFLIFLDDYLVIDYVDNLKVLKLFESAKLYNLQYLRLINNPKKHCKNSGSIEFFTPKHAYMINMQLAIWDRDFILMLLNCVHGSAWKFEEHINSSIADGLQAKCGFISNPPISYVNTIVRGKWEINAVPYLCEALANIDLNVRGVNTLKYLRFTKLRSWIGVNVPMKLRKPLKYLLSIFGFKFLTRS